MTRVMRLATIEPKPLEVQMVSFSGRIAYLAGVAIAVATSFVTVWTTIVRDDGNGIGFFLVIMAAAVGAFSASFRAAGMARAMLGVAIMQGLLGIAIATAPLTARMPGGAFRALSFSAILAALWLISATFFRAVSKGDHQA